MIRHAVNVVSGCGIEYKYDLYEDPLDCVFLNAKVVVQKNGPPLHVQEPDRLIYKNAWSVVSTS